MNNKKVINILRMIEDDMKEDAENFDGRPFNGRTIAEYLGNQGVAISILASIINLIIKQLENKEE